MTKLSDAMAAAADGPEPQTPVAGFSRPEPAADEQGQVRAAIDKTFGGESPPAPQELVTLPTAEAAAIDAPSAGPVYQAHQPAMVQRIRTVWIDRDSKLLHDHLASWRDALQEQAIPANVDLPTEHLRNQVCRVAMQVVAGIDEAMLRVYSENTKASYVMVPASEG